MTYNTQPTPQTVALGASADVRTMPEQPATGTGAASQTGLFPSETSLPVASGGLPPSRLDFNALFANLGASQYFQQRGGVWAWVSTYDYDPGALVSYSGAVYVALAASGPSESVGAVTPGTAAAADVWQELGGGTGAWSADGSLAVSDYSSANTTATYTFNDGDAVTVVMPSAFEFQSLSGSKTYTASEVRSIVGAWSVVPSSAAVYSFQLGYTDTTENTVTAQRTLTANPYSVTTDYYAKNATDSSWTTADHVLMSSNASAIASGASTYGWTGYALGGGFTSRTFEAASNGATYYRHGFYTANGFLGVRSAVTGTDPTPDTTATCYDKKGNTVTLTQVQECHSVFINERGVRWTGFNTVGSTIMACMKTEVAVPGNNYGTTVAGSQLCWAAWDAEGGQLRNQADGSLQLSGTWVKVSGQSSANNGTWGMGLYRRIL